MKYPTYVIYATAEEVKVKLTEKQLDKQRKVLKACDSLQVVEIDDALKAAVDIETYQYLVRFLMERTEQDSKDLK